MTLVDTIEEVDYSDLDDSSGETKTHIVNPIGNDHVAGPNATSKEIVFIAREFHIEIVALCGYRWVPKLNPDNYPECEACVEEARRLIQENE